MNRCERMIDAGRRKFLTGAGLAAAGVAAAQLPTPQAKAAPAPARVDYPSNRLANVADLPVISRDDSRLIGYIGWKDLMRVRAKQQTEETQRTTFFRIGPSAPNDKSG